MIKEGKGDGKLLINNETPIRILCVFSTLDRGGAETMCMNLFRNIDRSKVQFDFVKHVHYVGAYEKEILSLGGRIFEAPRFKVYNIIAYENWWRRFLINHSEYYTIHGYYFTISAIYLRVVKKLHRITVSHIHASAVSHRITELLIRQINRFSDYPLACSQQAGHWIYGNRPFTVLNNGIDCTAFCYTPEKRQVMRNELRLGDALTLGTVANLSQVKNPMGLIDVFLAVKKQRPDAKLIWVGEGNQRSVIEERLKKEQIEDCVTLLGTRTDVPEVLQAMDAFLLPSFSEGLPVSVIEAQASGLPCFISDRVTHEVDITGNCSFLPIDQPQAWADAILNCKVERKDTSEQIKTAGYDINTTAKWLEDFYLSISTNKHAYDHNPAD